MEKEALEKLASCMRRARRGEELTIGFLGGSITQGCLATEEERTYAYRVYRWWCDNFPQAQFHYVNGGIGGTSSHFGVARAERDVLMYQPDVVIVDFSVNDEPEEFFQETYEGVIRKVLGWQTNPAVLLLGNVYYDTGVSAQEYHEAVAKHYHIPYVSIRDTIYKEMKEGIYTREELTEDGLHPNDKGHGLVAGELIQVLEEAKKIAEVNEETGIQKEFPMPLTANAYEYARCLTIQNCVPKLCGFRADTEEKKGHLDCFKNGWIGKKKGDRLLLEVDASCIAVQYRKTIHKPTPVARLILDSDEANAVILDGNFEQDWGDCLYLQRVAHHIAPGKHTIQVEIIEDHEKDQVPFYLLSFILA